MSDTAIDLREHLDRYDTAGSAALMTVAWEIARLALTPIADALAADRLAYAGSTERHHLRLAAGALVSALASASPGQSLDNRAELVRRAALAIPILQLHALLLREQRDPSHFSPGALAIAVAAPLREALEPIKREQPSTLHSQQLLDKQLGRTVTAARAATAAIHGGNVAATAFALGGAGAPAAVDYNALCAALAAQDDIKSRWLAPLPGTDTVALLGVTDRPSALQALELPESAGLSEAREAFGAHARATLADLPGCTLLDRDGPRLRWLALASALTHVAWTDDAAGSPTSGSAVRTTAASRPTHVGRYALVDELGRGGMGVVYRAHDAQLDRRVAIKLLTATSTSAVAARERFVGEMRVMATLNHRSIVPVYDTGYQDGVPFIVMPLIDGCDLARVAAAGPLAPHRALNRAAELVEALAYLHERDLIHRDVKPENVLLEHAGRPHERALLADLGIARACHTGPGLTGPRQILGTPGWIAPEVRAGAPASPASDQWALGRLVAAMLLGDAATNDDLDDSLARLIGRRCAAAVMRALAEDSADRHRDVAAFGRALSGRRSTLATLVAYAPFRRTGTTMHSRGGGAVKNGVVLHGGHGTVELIVRDAGWPTDVPLITPARQGFGFTGLLGSRPDDALKEVMSALRRTRRGPVVAIVAPPAAPRPLGLLQPHDARYIAVLQAADDDLLHQFHLATTACLLERMDADFGSPDVVLAHPMVGPARRGLVDAVLAGVCEALTTRPLSLRRLHLVLGESGLQDFQAAALRLRTRETTDPGIPPRPISLSALRLPPWRLVTLLHVPGVASVIDPDQLDPDGRALWNSLLGDRASGPAGA